MVKINMYIVVAFCGLAYILYKIIMNAEDMKQ